VIAITFALPAESAGLVRQLREKQRRHCGDTRVITGKIDKRSVEILHTGVGEKICRRRVATFLQDRSAAGRIRRGEQFDLLISAGFAGATDERLKVGDLLLAQNFSTVNLAPVEALLSDFALHCGDVFTTTRIIDSRKDRDEIARSTGAAAVDMETDFIARLCAEHALPMFALRAISDTPARPLPLPPGVLFDIDQQKTKTVKLSLYALTHPARLPRLIGFGWQVRIARRALTRALETILRSGQL
jgi:nucleoside phosphorylase